MAATSASSGSLMQLVAYGAADIWLTGNPSITYFKSVYRRHTNFAMEMIEIPFQTAPVLNTCQTVKGTIKVGRYADLLHDVYLMVDLPDIFSNEENNFKWVRYLGNQLVTRTEVLIGGQRVDHQYGEWLTIWNELALNGSKKRSYYELIGYVPEMRPNYHSQTEVHLAIPARRLYVPLNFFFCNNSGLALPLIALQYQDVYINFEFAAINSLFTIGKPELSPDAFFSDCNDSDSNLLLKECLLEQGYTANNVFFKYARRWNPNFALAANFVYLDTDERRLYAQTTHEYLVPQVQRNEFVGLRGGANTTNNNSASNSFDLEFQHPCKELVWVYQRDDVAVTNNWTNFTRLRNPEDWAKINLISAGQLEILSQAPNNTLDNPLVIDFVKNVRANQTGPDGFSVSGQFDLGTNILERATLLLNAHERFAPRDSLYFSALQVYKYHTSQPNVPGINVYSFALRPENDSPSGTCNFSRIDKVEMRNILRSGESRFDVNGCGQCVSGGGDAGSPTAQPQPVTYNSRVYAYHYNILRVMAGSGALVFAN